MSSWKRDVASGLIVLVPILVTLYIVYWLYQAIAGLPFLANTNLHPATRVLLTLVIFVLLVFAIGYLMRTALGTFVEAQIDDLINRLPGLRVVYNASKMAVETALSDGSEFQRPVKIETWPGHRMTAFKTGKTTEDGREVLFIPTSPNITTGFVVEVDPDDIVETDENVEDALTRVLSAGFGESERDVDVQDVLGDE
ncbi:DUF502 domain-containing protein [Halocalculus aciditolerans]|uniref:DUF502 domain-containing protein n=1 Tax=Halocalculus aciditolerans TaxID=1383812 RepID=A0A830F804_9EURY|nr:DUF502 domain-containing protein [Halocalculus aciditolerans]GGL48879.1 hypothetical protein GCM10009039_03910 [Halocalculus aciditolerans]